MTVQDSPLASPPTEEEGARPPAGACEAPAEPAGFRYIYSLGLACLMCGRDVGTFISTTPLPTERAFVPASMRCGHCGGTPVFTGEVGREFAPAPRVHIEPAPIGRPPKALVAARRTGTAPPPFETRCSNCRRYGHHSSACPRPRRTMLKVTVCVPGTTIALLSRPSKMPGPSWSIPAGPACPFAVTGPNTICGSCYATTGNYTADPAIVRAQSARFEWTRQCMKSAEGVDAFVQTMVAAITAADAGPYMRVHDSGDLFSPIYTHAWIRVCAELPDVRFWFPTRSWRAPWLATIVELAALPNVTVRPSALHFDDAPPVIAGLHAGTTAKADGFSCPAPRQAGACGNCRHCWDAKDRPVSYHAHFVREAVAA